MELFIIYDGDSAGDIKVGFSVPTGATFHWLGDGGDLAMTDSSATHVSRSYKATTDTAARGAVGVGAKCVLIIKGHLISPSNTGSLTLRWAQSTSSGTATTIYGGSYLKMERVV